MGKDFKTLTENLGTEAVPKQYGGELPVGDVNGKLLAEFLKLFKDQFKCKVRFLGFLAEQTSSFLLLILHNLNIYTK